jgi:glutamate dehydrogenase/leucine dehydrogenase
MTELHRHIGEDVDVPAGDIGAGSREIKGGLSHEQLEFVHDKIKSLGSSLQVEPRRAQSREWGQSRFSKLFQSRKSIDTENE